MAKPRTNFEDFQSNYVSPDISIKSMTPSNTPGGPDRMFSVAGFFHPEDPDSVYLNPILPFIGGGQFSKGGVLAHEAQHRDFWKYRDQPARKARKEANIFMAGSKKADQEFNRLHEPYESLFGIDRLRDTFKGRKRRSGTEMYKRHMNRDGVGADLALDNDGLLASLIGYEASLPSGKTIMDTPLGVELFGNNPELYRLYLKNTMLNRDKFLPPEDFEGAGGDSILTKIQRFMRNRTAY